MSTPKTGPDAANAARQPRAWVVLVPALYVLLTALHSSSHPTVGDDTTVWVVLHLAQLVLIGGMACVFTALVADEMNTPAKLARALALPYAVAYSAFDSVAGIGMGLWLDEVNSLSAADQAAAARLLEAFVDPDAWWILLEFAASLSWLALAVAAVAARWDSAPRIALVLIGLGAVVFAVGHVRPIGPAGLLVLTTGVAWVQFGASRASRASHASRASRSTFPSGK
jgi:hypothetical protein